MSKRSLFVILIILGMGYGCSTKFSCNDTWSGTKCETMTSVYEKRDEIIPSRDDKHQKQWEGRGKVASSTEESYNKNARADGFSSDDINKMNELRSVIIERMEIDKNIPLKMPTTVLEIWVAPYEDENGDLRKPEMIYTEVENRRGKWFFNEKGAGVGVGSIFSPEMYEKIEQGSATQENLPQKGETKPGLFNNPKSPPVNESISQKTQKWNIVEPQRGSK